MNITQLEYFKAITQNDTFMDAANDMNISQSSLSKQLSRLEAEVGVALIDRSKRKASLTEAGKIFAKDIDSLLNQYQIMLSHMQTFKKDKNCSILKIGSLAFLGQYGLNYKLADFIASHSNEYRLIIEDVEEDILIEGFRNGTYDLILGRTLPGEIMADSAVKLEDDELVAVMRSSNPLAKFDSVEIPQLTNFPMFLTKPYTSIYKICMQVFEKEHTTPAKISTSRSETIISMIVAQNSVGLLPRKCFNIYQHAGLVALPVKPAIKIPVVIFVGHKRNSPFVQKLINSLLT